MTSPTNPPPSVSAQYLPALTGLRAVAAYLVFWYHHNPALVNTPMHRLLAQGYVGVTLFFVLSGFLIYHRYADVFFGAVNWSWKAYIQNRFARIYPLYALLYLLTVVSDVLRGYSPGLLPFGLNISLLKGFFADYKFTGIAQSWSLTVEVCFYLMAPFFFVALRRRGVLLISLLLLTVGLLLWLTASFIQYHGLFGNLSFVLFYTVFGRGFEFVAGMWLAHRWHTNRLPSIRFATVSGTGLVIGCVLWQALVPTYISSPAGRVWSEAIAYNYGLPVGVVLLMGGLLLEPTRLRRLLATSLAQGLGRSSYAFYLIHIGVVSKLIQHSLTTNKWVLFGVLILLAHGLYITVERPLQRWLRASRS